MAKFINNRYNCIANYNDLNLMKNSEITGY